MSNGWTEILTAEQLEAKYAFTAKLDPAFAKRDREFWESRADQQLKALETQSWLTNNPGAYQMARSYLALRRVA